MSYFILSGRRGRNYPSLLEDLDNESAKYLNLSETEFNKCLNADPTRVENSEGKYTDWILKAYAQSKKASKKFDFALCKELLTSFDGFQDDPRMGGEDIFLFETLDELNDHVQDMQVQVDYPNSSPTVNRYQGYPAGLVYDGDRCQIWTPYTHEAAVKLGEGTRWPVSYKSNDYSYEMFTEEGPLYILIMKSETQDKYLFQFETDTAVDERNRRVNVDNFPEVLEVEKKHPGIRNTHSGGVVRSQEEKLEDLLNAFESTHKVSYLTDLSKEIHSSLGTYSLQAKWIEKYDRAVYDEICREAASTHPDTAQMSSLAAKILNSSLRDECFKMCTKAEENRINSDSAPASINEIKNRYDVLANLPEGEKQRKQLNLLCHAIIDWIDRTPLDTAGASSLAYIRGLLYKEGIKQGLRTILSHEGVCYYIEKIEGAAQRMLSRNPPKEVNHKNISLMTSPGSHALEIPQGVEVFHMGVLYNSGIKVVFIPRSVHTIHKSPRNLFTHPRICIYCEVGKGEFRDSCTYNDDILYEFDWFYNVTEEEFERIVANEDV